MLSYQHGYHAGNLADLHKHALLATALDYLTKKDKPLSYVETHAGRGLYRLDSAEAQKTSEARAGIVRAVADGWLDPGHPLMRALTSIRREHGELTYPGSPMIAKKLLRPFDHAHLAELHPGEYAQLTQFTRFATIWHQDGFAMAMSVCPPTPRRGLMLIDPSYEIKRDYESIPGFIRQVNRKWNVGIIMLWYPVLVDNRHTSMIRTLAAEHPDAVISETRFAPARAGHSMIGSGMFIINSPWGLSDEAARLEQLFHTHA